MKKAFVFIISLASAVIVSCSSHTFNSHKQPDNLIPKDTMVEMIAEQLIYEATLDFVKQDIEREDTNLYQQVNHMIGNESLPMDSFQMGSMHVLTKLSGTYYGPWLKKRGITYEQYEESLIYYFNTAQTTEEIMRQVENRITQKYGNLIPPPSPNPAVTH